jgi:hypothetical protein
MRTQFMSLLDARNNSDAPDGLGFNAHEIRAAFLRFFVSIFRTYEDYLVAPSPQASHSCLYTATT